MSTTFSLIPKSEAHFIQEPIRLLFQDLRIQTLLFFVWFDFTYLILLKSLSSGIFLAISKATEATIENHILELHNYYRYIYLTKSDYFSMEKLKKN